MGFQPDAELMLVEDGQGLVPLVASAGQMNLAGPSDLTDYHSPLGVGADHLLAEAVSQLPSGTLVDLDSLPLEAAEPLAKGLEQAGIEAEVTEHTVAAVLELPTDIDGYLAAIGKKQRHEVRRKYRRYEEAVGDVVFETEPGSGWAFSEFARLHRLAAGEKGRFMTGGRGELFARLAEMPGWRTHLLRAGDRAVAALFGYADIEGYYLYNSAYDPALSDATPGVVVVVEAIKRAIAEGLPRFDFLKGDEVYKFRLGAARRQLYRVRGRV